MRSAKLVGVGFGMALLMTLVGCGASGGTLEPHRFTTLPPDHTEATVYYPKGDVFESVLMMRTSGPKTVRTGEEFEYKIELYNPTDQVVVKDIVVSDYVPPTFEVTSSTPTWTDLNRFEMKERLVTELRQPDEDLDDARKQRPRMVRQDAQDEEGQAGRVRWYIEELYPEKLVTIKVRGTATSEGYWKSCASASYDLSACMAARVVSPDLKLTTRMERDVILCETDTADISVRVSNTGSGKTEDVTVTVQLSDGMTYNGQQTIRERIGRLPAGETRTLNKSVQVDGPGTYSVKARAESRSGLSTDAATVELTAREADLDVEVRGAAEEYVGLPVEYELVVSNTGNAPARQTVVEAQIPKGAKFIDASHDGSVQSSAVQWQLGTLPAGQSQTLSVRLEGEQKGYLRSVVTARSKCSTDAEAATAIARTRLEGIASMVVEVVDTRDPIRVGNEEVYEIRVHNQGSAPETDILVACELPPGQRFVSASGATNVHSTSDQIVFRPVARLAADETATWEVKVEGEEPGDMRFRVTVESDQHGRPVRETEATRVFH